MKSLLILDASPAFLNSVGEELRSSYRVFTAASEREAHQVIAEHSLDLCVLDFYLDSGDGRKFFLELRERSPEVPCILVSARADKHLAIDALNSGIDFLLEKPFTTDELRAQIQKLLPTSGEFADLSLHEETFSVLLRGERIVLTPIEFQILDFLWARRNRLVKRAEIFGKLWGNMKVTDHTFDTHFSNMKRKIPELRNHIQVIRGQGYVLRS